MEKLVRMSKEGSGVVLWLTGLSGAGKSTIVRALAPQLEALGRRVEILDGDVVRTHLSGDLGFSRKDRDTNIARIAFVAHLLARNGVIVLVAAISPFRDARDRARAMQAAFVEIHVAPPLEECIRRDVKGLYKKAIAGEIEQFTGISDPYEEPLHPELRIDTSRVTVEEATACVLRSLLELGHLVEPEPKPQR
jgi:adenylylsulfate kinase